MDDASFSETLKYQDDQAEADKHVYVRFYEDEFKDEAASKEAGRAIYKTVECCEIRVPGDRDVTAGQCKYMVPDPRKRFAAAYARFKAGAKEQIVGTLLREWPMLPRSRAREYEDMRIYTVEQLAGLSDANAQHIPGSLAERSAAQDFLALAKGQAPLAKLHADIAERDARIAELEEQVKALSETKRRAKAS